MNKYFVSDKLNGKLIKSITKSEYEILKKFHPIFKKFENVFDCYFNFGLSRTRLEDFVDHTYKERELDLETIYSESRFLFLTNILMGRLFIDNLKSFANQLNVANLKKVIKDFEKLDEIKMMKLLRDFGQHYSLPFSNLKRSISITANTDVIELLISKSELNRNSGKNSRNDKFLSSINQEEISISEYFNKWCTSMENLFHSVINEFLNITPKSVMDLFSFLFSPIFIPAQGNKTFYPNAISEEEVISKNVPIPPTNQLGNFYKTIEVFRFKHEIVQLLLATKF
ncbi:TPA: hypothetical protein ACPQXX_001378 [Streptococcus mutans]|uniref:hypothetical protein n=1 Tax=Streptococcus mutans TaxID=1309 RepID=UPI0002B512C6|nr:hypothetical protein [Streptococcus mutans]EMB73121.1 hypothetical protein SMU36_03284 [Streptococcus mutans 4VF1]EMC32865.1 hypothetical protein SMU89_05271 [Streptococcus mutans NLML1]MCB5098365.1 hypothetical protein [Streptococcus mutans]MDW5565547.1 hypothetical protein [Streptococcus mutans]